MAAIDVGAAAIDRASSYDTARTIIFVVNPANLSGWITKVQVFVDLVTITGLRVGSFFLVGGTTYQCRDSATLGNAVSGLNTFFHDSSGNPLKIAVHAGDYIGAFWSISGRIKYDSPGGSGFYYSPLGEFIDPGDSAIYTLNAGPDFSVYGEGEVPAQYCGLLANKLVAVGCI